MLWLLSHYLDAIEVSHVMEMTVLFFSICAAMLQLSSSTWRSSSSSSSSSSTHIACCCFFLSLSLTLAFHSIMCVHGVPSHSTVMFRKVTMPSGG